MEWEQGFVAVARLKIEKAFCKSPKRKRTWMSQEVIVNGL